MEKNYNSFFTIQAVILAFAPTMCNKCKFMQRVE